MYRFYLVIIILLFSCGKNKEAVPSGETPKRIEIKNHIIVIAGQSNAVGQGEFSSCSEAEPTDPRILQLSNNDNLAGGNCPYQAPASNEWFLAQEGLQHKAASYKHGFGLKLAKYMLADYPSDHKILIVPVAQSSTSFKGGHWSKGQVNYEYMVLKIKKALEYPNSELTAIYWHQGESDSATSDSHAIAYHARLKQMILDLRSDVVEANEKPFIIGGMLESYINSSTTRQMVDRYHREMKQFLPNVNYASSSGTTSLDSLHFDKASLDLMANNFYDAFKQVDHIVVTPEITSITATETSFISTVPIGTEIATLSVTGGTPFQYNESHSSFNFSIINNDGSFSISNNKILTSRTFSSGEIVSVILSVEDFHGEKYQKNVQFTAQPPNVSEKSISFSGPTSKLIFNNSSNDFYDLTTGFTFSTWIKIPNLIGTQTIFDTSLNDSTYKGMKLYIKSSGHIETMLINNFGTSNFIISETFDSIPTGTWFRLTITYNGTGNHSGIKIYFDKALKTTLSSGVLTGSILTNNNIAIAGRPSSTGTNLVGKIDEVTIWSVALTQEDINQLIDSPDPESHNRSNDLEHRLKMGEDGDSITTIQDVKSLDNWSFSGSTFSISDDVIVN